MKRRLFHRIFCALLFSVAFAGSVLFAQPAGALCAVQFDRSVYSAGDTAWFAVYLPRSIQYEQSLTRVVLSGPDRGLLSDFHLPVRRKMSPGYFTFPHNIETGVYLATVHLYDKQTWQEITVLKHELLILNQDLLPEVLSFQGLEELKSIPENERLLVDISFKQETIGPRQQLVARIKVRDELGRPVQAQLSIAVTEETAYAGFRTSTISECAEPPFTAQDQIIFHGQATGAAIGPLPNTRRLAAFVQEDGYSKAVRIDKEGNFQLVLAPFSGLRTVQFWHPVDQQIDVMPEPPTGAVVHDRENRSLSMKRLDGLLQQITQRKKIDFLFTEPAAPPAAGRPPAWTHIPDFSIYPQEYVPFEDLQSFLKNISTPLKIKRIDKEWRPKMINPERKPYFHGEPVFIVDRVITPFDEVMALPIEDIQQIDLFNRSASLLPFGILGENGMAVIHTSLPNEPRDAENTFEIFGLQTPADYPRKVDPNEKNHQPLLPATVYWHPEVRTDERGETILTFFHSDETGIFRMEVLGRSNQGKIGQQVSTYEVKL